MKTELKTVVSYVNDMVDGKVITPDFGITLLKALKKDMQIAKKLAEEETRATIYKIVSIDEGLDREELKKKIMNFEFNESVEV